MQLIPQNTEKVLSIFAKKVKDEAIKNAPKSSEKLKKSIDYDLQVHKQSFSLSFEMEEHGHYQDKGVSGKKKKYNTPFSYKDKKPPISVFDKWVIKKGIAPRDSKGKFQNRNSIKYAIANHIFINGISPKKFFTNPFEKEFTKLPDDVVEAFALDTELFYKQIFKDDINT